MLIERLTMLNFGPFFGEHIIELGVSPSAPVVVVHGENMRGKTSLQNAIRWCMYGYALGRGGAKKPSHRLISYDALDAHQFVTRVMLDFTHDHQSYRLERSVQAEARPLSDNELEERMSLTRDGSFVAEQEIPEIVNGILHEQIARFFLFDGEMLAQYEQLVSEPGHQTQLIRQSIEQILGLPALRVLGEDAEGLRRAAEREQAKAVRGVDKAAQLSADAEQLQSEIESIEKDLKDLADLRNSYTQDRDRAAEQRERYDEIQAELHEADSLESSIAEAERTQETIKEEIQVLLASCWWEPIAPLAAASADELANGARKALRGGRAGRITEAAARSA